MTIITQPTKMQKFTITGENNTTSTTSSPHDSFSVKFASVNNRFDKEPNNVTLSISEFKENLIDFGKVTVKDKTQLPGLLAAIYVEGCKTKKEDFALTRHILFLDFDEAPDIDYITTQLSQWAFYAWTTHSHQAPNKGNRYRVAIPFIESPNKTEWKTSYSSRVKAWIHDLGFVGDNKVDMSCLTFAQIGYLPSINPQVGHMSFWFNDDVGTRIFSLSNDLPELTEEEITFSQSAEAIHDWQPTTEERRLLINTLKSKPSLYSIDANPTPENNGVNRKTIAAALQSIGVDYGDFIELDHVMRKGDSNTSTEQAWKQAQVLRNKHAGVLYRLLVTSERRLVGLNTAHAQKVTLAAQRRWDRIEPINYLTRAHYGSAHHVLVNADMGTGKNFLWTHHKNTEDDRVIVLSPLKSIVGQQGSDNDVRNSHNTTFTYDQSKNTLSLITSGVIDPSKTTLVIDECHNLLLAEYRLDALANVERLFACPFKQIIFQSATIEPNSFDGFFTFDQCFRYTKSNGASLNYTMANVGSGNIEHAIIAIINQQLGTNRKILCLWNNKDNLTGVKAILTKAGIRSEIISADQLKVVGTEAYKLANDVDYKMDGLQILFGTTSLVEGVSIKDNIDIGTVIIIGKEPPAYIKQMCGRFRCAKKIECWHISLADEDEINDVNEWIADKRREMILCSELAATLNKTLGSFNFTDHIAFARSQSCAKTANAFAAKQGLVFNQITNRYEPSSYGQLFLNTDLEKAEFYSSRDKAAEVMERMGFNHFHIPKGMIFKANDIDKKMIKGIKRNVEGKLLSQRKNSVEPIINAIRQITKHYGEEYLDSEMIRKFVDLDEQLHSSDAFQSEALAVIGSLVNRHKDADYLIAQLEALANKKQKTLTIETREYSEAADSGIYKELKNRYPSGSVLTVEEQRNVITDIITREMQLLATVRTAFTTEQLFAHVAKNKLLKSHVGKGTIRLEGDVVVVSIDRPLALLNNWIELRSEKRRIGGRCCSVAITV